MFYYLHLASWWLKAFTKREFLPINSIIAVKEPYKSFQQIVDELKYCYRAGSRNIRFDGSPLSWQQAGFNFDEVIKRAKKIGFHSIEVFWDGQSPLNTKADKIWLYLSSAELIDIFSINSVQKDNIIIKNIANWAKENIYLILNLQKHNYTQLEDILKFCAGNPKISSVAVFLSGESEYNGLSLELKHSILEKIIELKKNGYPIYNELNLLQYEYKNDSAPLKYSVNYINLEGNKELVSVNSPFSPIILPLCK